MRNIKITIEYDGSRYQGWTRLGKDESNNTISAKIIDVLGKMTGEKNIELNCGCRTEVGVHAVSYTHLNCEKWRVRKYIPEIIRRITENVRASSMILQVSDILLS